MIRGLLTGILVSVCLAGDLSAANALKVGEPAYDSSLVGGNDLRDRLENALADSLHRFKAGLDEISVKNCSIKVKKILVKRCNFRERAIARTMLINLTEVSDVEVSQIGAVKALNFRFTKKIWRIREKSYQLFQSITDVPPALLPEIDSFDRDIFIQTKKSRMVEEYLKSHGVFSASKIYTCYGYYYNEDNIGGMKIFLDYKDTSKIQKDLYALIKSCS
ncbi:hypothetical protein GR183_00660 [Stappia sp. GBMRC 2046]|uniref:Uncharacterized protein n=1 Tax=Stappia sediminis TaxID=2692190 RepID=A0A7X3LQT9_9HYPH|nr:hypothetical protein [Stappia sediminis]MXN63401.1 hypothetical protein [Stappia sediminis]